MKKGIWIFTTAALFSCTTVSSEELPAVNGKARVHTIYELNTGRETADSHAGDESFSVLESDYNYMQIIPKSLLGLDAPIYARVKKCADGSYLLMYQGSSIASRIYYSRSGDLKSWSKGQALFSPYAVTTPDGDDERRFSSADAIVLANGDILAVTSYRANKGYSRYPQCNGLMMRRSTDNGLTWGPEQEIYVGTNWEPYMLQLPSGEIQCYFTDVENLAVRSSGTSIVVSNDNGHTWQPDALGERYAVIRQFKYMDGTAPVYTDQMPSVKLLNDGVTLLGFMEARMEPEAGSSESTYWLSVVYGDREWKHLGKGETGPDDRQTNVVRGAAGYVAQFRSGETLISCNIDNVFSMKLGDHKGRSFNGRSWSKDWYQPFGLKGYWGSTEVIADHEVLGTIHCADGIQLGRFYLNHRIDAPRAEVTVDGDNSEWNHSQALFLGSESPMQMVFRAACDEDNLYIMAERSGVMAAANDNLELLFHNPAQPKLGEKSIRLVLAPSQLKSCTVYKGSWKETHIEGVRCMCAAVRGVDGGRDGHVYEIAIPLSVLGVTHGERVMFNAVAYNGSHRDTFTSAEQSNPAGWLPIDMK